MSGSELPDFVAGLDLSESFFRQAVRPIMTSQFPDVRFSAGHLARGSDVLGFDTPQSRDHDWGPKATLFVGENDFRDYESAIITMLREHLPHEVDGYPVHFDRPDLDGGTLTPPGGQPIHHGVNVTTVRRFTERYLGVDASSSLNDLAWLRIPSQRLGTIRSGRVFADQLGVLNQLQTRLRWYPRDVWLYRMAAAWRRIDQEEPFVGRCGDVGDELGSRLVAMRQIIELMRLAFLQERQYAPYMKWFGTSFRRLESADSLLPIFNAVFDARDWRSRESAVNEAYLFLGERHNALAVTDRVSVGLSSFHHRPYTVPHSHRFVDALLDAVESEEVRLWPREIGGIDQFVDSTDVLDSIGRMKTIGAAFESTRL